MTLRIPYPMGYYGKGFDGRIDDANAGWKGKGVYTTFATRALSLTPVINVPREYQNKIPYRFWETWYSLEDRAILWAAGREFKREGNPVVLTRQGYYARKNDKPMTP